MGIRLVIESIAGEQANYLGMERYGFRPINH